MPVYKTAKTLCYLSVIKKICRFFATAAFAFVAEFTISELRITIYT
jgi:hypothetical protein